MYILGAAVAPHPLPAGLGSYCSHLYRATVWTYKIGNWVIFCIKNCLYFQNCREMGLPQKISWFLANASSSIALMITIFFWFFLYDGVNTFANTFLHLLNSVRYCMLIMTLWSLQMFNSVIIDLTIVSRPAKLLHFLHPLLFGLWYLTFSIVYWAVGGTDPQGNHWIYPMVDWDRPALALATSAGCIAGKFWGVV